MKRCMNIMCGAVGYEGVEITVIHEDSRTGKRDTAKLWACCADCATEVQFAHANKSAIRGAVLPAHELAPRAMLS